MSYLRSELGDASILGAGRCFPEDLVGESARLSNSAAASELLGGSGPGRAPATEFDPERFGRGVGVQQRGWSRGRGLGTLELAVAAGQAALEDTGCAAGALDAVFVATCTPPHITKNLAALVVHGLNASAAGVDVRAGGAGGLEAWIAGAGAVAAGAQRVLVVAAEASSHYANPADPANALLFGDGAAALVLGPGAAAGGRGGRLLLARSGTAKVAGQAFTVPGALPPLAEPVLAGAYRFQRPDEPYKRALAEVWEQAAAQILADLRAAGRRAEAWLPYGVSVRQLAALAASSGLPVKAAQAQLRDHGCLGSAGTLALVAQRMGAASDAGQEQVIASLAVGGGVSWCGLAWLG